MKRNTKIKITYLLVPVYGLNLTFLFFLASIAYSYIIFGNPPIDSGRIWAGVLATVITTLISTISSCVIWMDNHEQVSN